MNKKFTVEVEMEERWVNHFMSMLREMEKLGITGSSQTVSLFSDGDGDFRPKFKADIDWEEVEPSDKTTNHYDAG